MRIGHPERDPNRSSDPPSHLQVVDVVGLHVVGELDGRAAGVELTRCCAASANGEGTAAALLSQVTVRTPLMFPWKVHTNG